MGCFALLSAHFISFHLFLYIYFFYIRLGPSTEAIIRYFRRALWRTLLLTNQNLFQVFSLYLSLSLNMDDPIYAPSVSTYTNDADDQFNRNRPRRTATKLAPGQVSFLVLIPDFPGRGIIGNDAAVVSHIQRETGTRIHWDVPAPGSDHRVVSVAGSGAVDRRISLLHGGEELRDVSSAQEAMLRVWEAIAVNEGGAMGGEVCCRLLAHTSQIGAVMGKGGKNIKRVKSDSGAKFIRILRAHPHSTANDHQLIQVSSHPFFFFSFFFFFNVVFNVLYIH